MSALTNIFRVACVGAGMAAVYGLGWLVSPRITDREIAFKIENGKLVDAHVESGVKMDALQPKVDYVRLPATMIETSTSATKDNENNVRIDGDARVYGTWTVMMQFEREHKDIDQVYNTLRIDEEEDIATALFPKVQAMLLSAVVNTYKAVKTDNLNDDATNGERVKNKLQEILDGFGLGYVKVLGVLPSGVGLSEKANKDLEQIVSEQRKLDLQKVQIQVAQAAIEVTEKQAEVTIKAFESLRRAGVPEEQVVQAYYLQLLRDADKIGTPNVPGPIPGTGVGSFGR